MDRARRAGRGRRRRRRLHVARVRGRDPAGLPQAVARRWSPASTATRPARPCCAPPPRSRARSARGSWPRASSGPRSSRRCARWRSTTARAGCSAARARRGRPTRRPPPVAPCRGKASGRLERDLERACTARVASEAVVDHLARQGLLPSVFLAQAGRLRSQAARGRWQVHDGLSPTAGIVGRVFRTGESAVVDDIGDAPDYLPTVPGVRAEVCFPLRAGGQIVGVLDAESLTAIDAATVAEVERCAALLSARLEEVGALGPASPAQRLARISARLASSEDPEGVVREALARRDRAVRLRVRGGRAGRRPRRAVPAPGRGPVRGRVQPARAARARRDGRLGRRGHVVLHRRRHGGPRLRRPRGAAPRRRRVADRAAAGGGRRARRPHRGRRPRAPPPGVRGHRAARAARAAGGQRAPDGVRAVPAARVARPADRPARVAADRARTARSCSSTSTASARSTATAARPRATTSCAPPPGCCASSRPRAARRSGSAPTSSW